MDAKIAGILRRPYSRVLIPDENTGGYCAHILEFPGCITEADTAEEALERLEAVAESWLQAVLDAGQQVPGPYVCNGYSGNLRLRMPSELHRRAAECAKREGTSLNQFIACAVAERVGASVTSL